MLDPACTLATFADALYVGRACDEGGYFWYEDPYRDSGVSAFAHKRLREALKTPILQTEHVRGVEPKADFLIAGGTDLLRSDPEYDMGITGAMKIAHLGEAFGIDVEVHASGPAHRHVMAAMRNTNFYEVALGRARLPERGRAGLSLRLFRPARLHRRRRLRRRAHRPRPRRRLRLGLHRSQSHRFDGV